METFSLGQKGTSVFKEGCEKMSENGQREYDTKAILEQMREEYWKGITEAEVEEAKDLVQLVTVVLGSELFGIRAEQTKEIIKMPNLVRVPKTPPSIMGIFNLRGKITSVVDIRHPLGLKMPPFDEHARVVVVETGGLSTGVAVEEVREIISVSAEKIMPVARMIADRDFMPGQIELEGEVIVLLDMEKILRAKDFQVNA